MTKPLEISNHEYLVFRDFLAQSTGILLGDNKLYLVSSRLQAIFSEHNIQTLQELTLKISLQSGAVLKDQVIEAMTTNETNWFRDNHPFLVLNDIIFPDLDKFKHNEPLRIWSAASSSGQEAYSISIVFSEYLQQHSQAFPRGMQIIGTDISAKILNQAKKAEYDKFAMGRGISPQRQANFFEAVDDSVMRVKLRERQRVQFKIINLLNSYQSFGKFQVIFCRNVLIYFSSKNKIDIIKRLSEALVPGGYLFLGASESIGQDNNTFEMLKCNPGIVYRKLS